MNDNNWRFWTMLHRPTAVTGGRIRTLANPEMATAWADHWARTHAGRWEIGRDGKYYLRGKLPPDQVAR
jgi:hypothetical protein